MSTFKDFLVEIGTEELPPKALRRLMIAFGEGVKEGLAKADLVRGEVHFYATPRRLAVLVKDLAVAQPDKEVERRGPALTAAFDGEGNPTQAARGFAASCGVEVDQLDHLKTDKGAWLVHRTRLQGRPTAELLPEIVQASLDKLPIPKRMRWGSLDAEFVRPVHWVVMLFGTDVIDCEILATRSGRETRGHRFMSPGKLYLGEPAAYAPLLETEGKVVADFEARREAVRAQVLEAAAAVNGEALIDEDLLDEVAGLVEWPVAVTGKFEERFLEVPAEALISTMKGNQKYFPVQDKDGKLLPYFITLSNIESHDVRHVREGNERVVRPRLTDADFFWNQDRKQKLAARSAALRSVVFQNKLGTLADKSARVAKLAAAVAYHIGGDAKLATRAGELSKCDLLTNMVGEFPELQGIMGRYYAAHDGEDAEVAAALDEQYMPRFAGDRLPETRTGQALAIADRIDTLVGIFGIGQPPTGDKDPFALRRAALGVLRTIIENNLDLDLQTLLRTAYDNYGSNGIKLAADTVNQVLEFMLERLRAYYADSGVAHDTFDAVLAQRPTQPRDFDARVRAVTTFRKLPEAEALAAANKRIANILRQAGGEITAGIDKARLLDTAEKALADQVEAMAGKVAPLFVQRNYTEALCQLAGLRGAVDAFFDQVMVMAEDETVRNNRLALLKRLSDLFLQAADLSRLQG
ncbi:glycine--tRNA ligase subunit beta [Sulfurivermis fontis]|uniref:glycine--tRNA ligase subunit beta n=1 Tax=Sulfurivermis fontis TaxID=1972068 RepID=UPI000FD8419E|nr:glycine--tRNA ligase subunit beta [Sulfurivermis fontis]